MSIKIRVHGLRYVERMMRSKRMQLGRGVQSVLVGYGDDTTLNSSQPPQNYAIYVHEDLEARHLNGQAKFLTEAPFTKDELAEIVAQSLKDGKTLMQGLEQAGQLVLDRSEPLVPIDTGALVESGFVRREGQEE